MVQAYQPGRRLSYGGALCTVRYVGDVAGTSGAWLGVEWDDPSRGKHDGAHQGRRYFTCQSSSPTAASFVRPARPADPAQTFVSAVHEKYASEVTADQVPVRQGREVVISGKVAEEVGFDKIRRKLAQLHELKIVILDGMRIAYAGAATEKSIKETCPRIAELDLSRNLFTEFKTAVDICAQLEELRSLRMNGNRLQNILEDGELGDAEKVFGGVKDLALEETLMTWEEISHVASKFQSLNTLSASTNQLSSLAPVSFSASLASALTSLNLEYNEFTSLSDMASLAALRSLRNLHLKGNSIAAVTPDASTPHPVFAPALHYLDISYNQVSSWSFVDALPAIFPGLVSLRFAHNPIYDNPAFEADPSAATSSSGVKATAVTEEAYMITVGRLAALKSLNFSAVTPADRTNAEMFYLSRIARQMASVPEGGAEQDVVAQHRRYPELCELYGEPAVVRRTEVNPAFLEARLITVLFHLQPRGEDAGGEAGRNPPTEGAAGEKVERTVEIPKSFDIYAVKGIAGKLFGLPPPRLRLIWETGEWDPVANFDEEAGDSSDDEEMELAKEKQGVSDDDENYERERKGGRWVKREAELRDSPRAFGFCVDGQEATVRVELR